ncbi:MAG: hypothetical protein HYR60_31930 [Acidobacteria bacterium]|nr:hypothetical protein [Acidobacteriota bacterium]
MKSFILIIGLLLAVMAAAGDRERFADPPAEFRSMPLWVWNDQLEWPRLKEQLGEFRRQGMGGVFVHPRPGLMTEYLGADWFRLWKLSVEESKRLGLFVNIYDENSYPAGFAGGHVPAMAPDTVAQYVQAELDVPPERVPWKAAETVAVFASREGPRVHRADGLPPGARAVVFRLRRASGNPWTGGFPYVDLTNPQTASAFIETTYERYKKHLGAEFGKTIRWVFDDEPLIATGGAYDQASLALPLSPYTLAEFRKRHGYDLADHLPSLYWDVGDWRRLRFDYWQTLHDVWKENYFQPLYQWCDRNRLQFTGHWMEHEWPYPWISPADASMYAFQHVPGIDMLEGSNIRTKGSDPHMLFTIKQVASVAHQLGRRAFCEAYGVSGWDSTFEHYKRFGDWLLAHGVNFIDQHLAFATVRGARKRDHPQSFSGVSAWWPYYKLHGDHLGRVSYMLSQGAARNRLLVLQPTTSGFLWARRGDPTPELAGMRADNGEMIQFLADHQVDFDLGDEYLLEWHGGQDGRRLAIGQARYELLVWPANMINLRGETLPRLERYLAAGGEILALAPAAAYVDGRSSDRVAVLQTRYAAQWRAVSGLEDLLREIRRRLKPRVKLDAALPNVGVSERFLENGDRVIFFANTGVSAARAKLTVDAGSLERWDTITGRIETAESPFNLELPPAGSELLVAKKAAAAARPNAEPRFTNLAAGVWRVSPEAPNVLVLDYCDLAVPPSIAGLRDVNTWEANWRLWQEHGFVRPAWDNAVQFKTRVFDQNHFDPRSGFEAAFRFDAADVAALRGLELAVEEPALYRVTLNGNPVSFEGTARWLDPHLRSVAVEKWARVGENIIRIAGRPFDVRMELENIYLRGNFSVRAAEKGFRLAAPARLDFGSWAAQGYPFYPDAVLYATQVQVPAGAGRMRVELGRWEGSVAAVLLDGRQVAALGWQPHRAEFSAAPGNHSVGVRIVSTPRNLFGPFHNRTKPRMRAWPAAWNDFPQRQPPGARYDVLDYGLMSPVTVSVAP